MNETSATVDVDRASAELGQGQAAQVRLLAHRHARIGSQGRRQLVGPHVDGEDVRCIPAPAEPA